VWVRRQAGWLPQAQEDLDSCLAGHRDRVESADTTPLHPVLREFHDLIEIDPLVRMPPPIGPWCCGWPGRIPLGELTRLPASSGSPPCRTPRAQSTRHG
jgi:hypothetical protein